MTLEGGAPVPTPRGTMAPEVSREVRLQKARFGDEIFDVAVRAGDRAEMEAGIVAAYDRARAQIERLEEGGDDGPRGGGGGQETAAWERP